MGSLHAQAQIAAGDLARSALWCQEHIWAYIREDTLNAKQKSTGLSGTNARFPLEGEQRSFGTSSRRTIAASTTPMERRPIFNTDVSSNSSENLRSRSLRSSSTAAQSQPTQWSCQLAQRPWQGAAGSEEAIDVEALDFSVGGGWHF